MDGRQQCRAEHRYRDRTAVMGTCQKCHPHAGCPLSSVKETSFKLNVMRQNRLWNMLSTTLRGSRLTQAAFGVP